MNVDNPRGSVAGGPLAAGSVLSPLVVSGGAPMPIGTVAPGTAFKATFVRAIVPVTGVLHDISVYNGTTVAGNTNVAVFDTGDTLAGSYSPLWSSGSVAQGAANTWQVVGDPALSVVAGQHLMLGLMSDSVTATYGKGAAIIAAAEVQLPANFLPCAGGALPKLVGVRTFGSLVYAAVTEVNMAVVSTSFVVIGRIS